MLSEQLIHAGRTADFTIKLFDGSGGAVAIANNDTVRVKVYRGAETPLLDLTSTAATLNGSAVTVVTAGGNTINVRFAQADTSSATVGPYTLEINVVDANDGASPADPIKYADFGVLHILAAGGGNTAI